MVERGFVKWFNNRAGWGFIARCNAPDLYVRHDEILGEGFKSLRAGDLVEFVVRKGRRGPCACEVRILAPAARGEEPQAPSAPLPQRAS